MRKLRHRGAKSLVQSLGDCRAQIQTHKVWLVSQLCTVMPWDELCARPGAVAMRPRRPCPQGAHRKQQGWWSLEEKSALWKMVAQKRVLNSPWELGNCQWLPTIQVCFCQLCWPHRHRELRITASPNLRFSPHTCFPMLEGRTQAQGPHCLYIQILSFSW